MLAKHVEKHCFSSTIVARQDMHSVVENSCDHANDLSHPRTAVGQICARASVEIAHELRACQDVTRARQICTPGQIVAPRADA